MTSNGHWNLTDRHDRKPVTDDQVIAKIDQIYTGLAQLDACTAIDLHHLYANINDGNFGAIRDAACSAFIDIAEAEAWDASVAGMDSSDLKIVNPVADHVNTKALEYNLHLTSFDATAEQYAAASIAYDTALAYVHSGYILDRRFPHFGQEAFDHLTRPYREIVNALGDEAAPASWAKRPVEQDVIDAMQFDIRLNVIDIEAAAEHALIHQTVMSALDQDAV